MSSEEGINPNVDITDGDQPQEGVGETLSFDDIENKLSNTPKKAAPKPKKEAKENPPAPLNPEKEEDKQQTENKEETQAVEIKKLAAKLGEEDYELPEDVLVPVKINGKEELVNLNELRSGWSGKVAYDKKFSELNNERQEYTTEKQQIESQLKEFVEASQNNNIMEAIGVLGKMSGQDPLEFTKQFRESVYNELSDYYNKSEDERAIADSKYEIEYQRKQLEADQQRIQQEEQNKQYTTEINEIIERRGINQEEFKQAYEEFMNANLQELIPEGQDFTPAHVELYIENRARHGLITEELSKIDETLASDNDVVAELLETTMNNGMDDKTTIEIIAEVYGTPDSAPKKVIRKAEKNNGGSKDDNLKATANKIVKEQQNVFSFDEL